MTPEMRQEIIECFDEFIERDQKRLAKLEQGIKGCRIIYTASAVFFIFAAFTAVGAFIAYLRGEGCVEPWTPAAIMVLGFLWKPGISRLADYMEVKSYQAIGRVKNSIAYYEDMKSRYKKDGQEVIYETKHTE